MAHYAFLDEKNFVVDVIAGKSEGNMDWETYYSMQRGMACKRTSYNTQGGVHDSGGQPFRKNFAGIGYQYDPQRDAFIPPKPFDSWMLNEESCLWEQPLPMPADGGPYAWDESVQAWAKQ